MTEGHNKPCYYCGKPCNSLAGDPGQWAIALCHRDEPGVVKWHHERCVSERLIENQPVTPAPEERTQEAMTLLREAHMFATAQAFVADDFDAHCDRLAKFLGYTVDTHGPIKEKE